MVENGDDAGLSTRKLRVRVPPGVLVRLLAVGELATPPASGAGDRRFDSCQPDLRGRGAAVLASLMSSRPWVRIPPALPPGGVAQPSRALACQARGCRFESGRPRSWWPWCKRRAPEVVSLAVPVRVRSVTPPCGRRASVSSTGCNPAASCCGGSTPPVRISAIRERRNACLRRRAIHNDLLGPARGRSDQRSSSAMCQRGDRRALPNVARRRPRGAARSARSSRRCVPRTRRPTPNRGRAVQRDDTLIEAEVRRWDLASHGSGGAQSPPKLVWPFIRRTFWG